MTFVDIDELKRVQFDADLSRRYAEQIVDTVREPLLVLDKEMRVLSANRAFVAMFQVSASETIGQRIYELGNQQWNIPALRELLEQILPENNAFEGFKVQHDFPNVGKKTMLLNARRIDAPDGSDRLILLAMEERTP